MEYTKLLHELRERFSLPHVLLVAIVILWATGYLLPQLSHLSEFAADLQQARDLSSERRQLIADRDRIINTYKRFTDDRLPQRDQEEDATAVMRLLTEQAAKSKVDMVRLNPSNLQRVRDIQQVGAEAELRGPLKSLVRYIFDLEHGTDPLLIIYLDLRDAPGKRTGMEARITAVQPLP